jgi:hypothetical protein
MTIIRENHNYKYFRYEPTSDETAIKHMSPSQLAKAKDVVVYNDKHSSNKFFTIPWDQKKPRKNSKTWVLNGTCWDILWLNDL